MSKIPAFSLTILLLSTTVAHAINSQGMQDTMGAFSKYLSSKTAVAGVNEKEDKLTPTADLKFRELENDLEPCVTTKTNEPEIVIIGQDGVEAKFKKFDISIGGDKCPMTLIAKVENSVETNDHIEAKFIMSLDLKDPSLVQKYQMKKMKVSGDISSRVSKAGSLITIPTKITMVAHGEDSDSKVTEQSMTMGVNVSVDLSKFAFGMDMEQSGYLTTDNKTDTFSSKTSLKGFGNFSAEFKVNNKQVSQSEFEKFMQAFMVAGNVEEEDPNAPDVRTKTQCSYAVYEKATINSELLKSQLTNGNLQTAGQLSKGQSCMQDITFSFNANSTSYKNSLSFGQDWISLMSDAKTAGEKAGVYILYQDTQAQTHESDSFIFGMQCKPVNVCH